MVSSFRATGGYSRGAETKQRIIDKAVDCFGRHGFAGTSTRNIAAAARVNTPAISYYFKSKAGLHRACINQLTGRVLQGIAIPVAACQSSVKDKAPLDTLIARLNEIQDCVID